MPVYATIAELAAYPGGSAVTGDATTKGALLDEASRAIDAVFGPRPILELGAYAGMKLDPTTLKGWEAKALSRATCAQAIHLFATPAADTDQARPLKAVGGPDFSETYADIGPDGRAPSGRYSPRVALELKAIGHLRRLGGTIRG